MQKARRRGSPLPRVGINYHGLWARRWRRENRPRLSEFVNVTVTVGPCDDSLSDAVLSCLRSTERVPYTDNGIGVAKRALHAALVQTGHTDVVVACA